MKNLFSKKLYSLKIFAYLLFFHLLFFDTLAQSLAVNSTGAAANPSALLDVSSLNKGVLIPRVSLTGIFDITTITAPAVSLLVYNTNATITGGSGTGYYYFTGAKWLRITDDSNYNPGWSLTGNPATVPGTNFVGTTDAADLMFKTNNLQRMTISSAGYAAINTTPTNNDYLNVYRGTKGPGLTNINAFNEANAAGTAWDVSGVAAMIKGYSYWGNPFSAGIAGYSFQDFAGSAAVIGARFNGSGAGFLGYFDGTTQYGLYTPSTVPANIGGNLEVYGAIMPNGLAGTAGQVLTSAGAGVPATWAAAGSGSGWSLTGNGGTTAGTNFVGTTDLVDLVFKTNGAENMRVVNGTGNVGINQNLPLERLHINGNTRFQGNSFITNSNSHFAFNVGNSITYRLDGMNISNQLDYGDYNAPATVFRLPTASSMNFQNSGLVSELFIQTGTGNVGINQNLPLEKLHINGNTRFQGNSFITNSNSHFAYNVGNSITYRLDGMNISNQLDYGDYNAPATVFRLPTASSMNFQNSGLVSELFIQTGTGNVGLGTTTPTHQLELSTDNAAKPGTNTWTIFSDKRLKQNIRPYTDGLSKLLEIEPIEYNYNERSGFDTKPAYVGVVAQDLQKIAPYMVGKFKKNGEEFLDVNTSAMTYMMVNAIKEQQKMIEELKKEIEALKKK